MGPSGETEVDSLESLFLGCLQRLYDAEQRLLEVLPRMAEAAHSASLQHSFRQHLQETNNQVARLERAFQSVGRPARSRTSYAMQGLLEDAQAALAAGAPAPIRDAALIAAAQNVVHYELSAYGTSRAFARQLGHEEAAQLLGETLFEEAARDRWLTRLAEGSINARARVP
jgi:ferritin-like metal-binding protein YciE